MKCIQWQYHHYRQHRRGYKSCTLPRCCQWSMHQQLSHSCLHKYWLITLWRCLQHIPHNSCSLCQYSCDRVNRILNETNFTITDPVIGVVPSPTTRYTGSWSAIHFEHIWNASLAIRGSTGSASVTQIIALRACSIITVVAVVTRASSWVETGIWDTFSAISVRGACAPRAKIETILAATSSIIEHSCSTPRYCVLFRLTCGGFS